MQIKCREEQWGLGTGGCMVHQGAFCVCAHQETCINTCQKSTYTRVIHSSKHTYTYITTYQYIHLYVHVGRPISCIYRSIYQYVCIYIQHIYRYTYAYMDFQGGASGKEPARQCKRSKRCGINPWAGKIPWRWKWQPTPAFLPGESHGQRSLMGYSP